MTKIAIIPARSGSKRITDKNIKSFLGKPIITYSIKTAIESNLFDEVMVSTDCEEIAKIATSFGAKVPFYRTKKNASDYATTLEVLKEVINQYKINGFDYAYGCCLYSTAPFVMPNHLKEAYEKILDKSFDTVISAVKYGHPIERAFKLENGCRIKLNNPQKEFIRTQDLIPQYHDAGQFYWFNVKSLFKNNSLLNGNVGAIIMKEIEVHDIDNPHDWLIAENKYKFLKKIIR